MTTVKNVTEKKGKKLKSLIGFLSANKIDIYNRGGKKSKSIYRSSQNIRIINAFLESLLSSPFPHGVSQSTSLPRMPSNTVLISGPDVGAAQIPIWSYSCVFLLPMSTDIRASFFVFFSFVGTLNDLLYIQLTQSV